MGFYDLSKKQRNELVHSMEEDIKRDLKTGKTISIHKYAADDDTYIRKNAYLILGRLYRDQEDLHENILKATETLYEDVDDKKRQTAVYTWTEIGKIDADRVKRHLEWALTDQSHQVKNGIMGGLKQMCQKNPTPTLEFAQTHLHDPDPEVRRIIIHGMELRGRTHPEEILPLLGQLQHEDHPRVRPMLLHVIGQISYKKGCLEKVTIFLKDWENQDLVADAKAEIVSVHQRYKFASKTPEEAEKYLQRELTK